MNDDLAVAARHHTVLKSGEILRFYRKEKEEKKTSWWAANAESSTITT